MDDTMETIKSLEESGLLRKGVAKQLRSEWKNKEVDFPISY